MGFGAWPWLGAAEVNNSKTRTCKKDNFQRLKKAKKIINYRAKYFDLFDFFYLNLQRGKLIREFVVNSII